MFAGASAGCGQAQRADEAFKFDRRPKTHASARDQSRVGANHDSLTFVRWLATSSHRHETRSDGKKYQYHALTALVPQPLARAGAFDVLWNDRMERNHKGMKQRPQ